MTAASLIALRGSERFIAASSHRYQELCAVKAAHTQENLTRHGAE